MTSLSGIHRVSPAPSLVGAGLSDTRDQRSRARHETLPQPVQTPVSSPSRTVGCFVDAFA
jgi:hypothetical protein